MGTDRIRAKNSKFFEDELLVDKKGAPQTLRSVGLASLDK